MWLKWRISSLVISSQDQFTPLFEDQDLSHLLTIIAKCFKSDLNQDVKIEAKVVSDEEVPFDVLMATIESVEISLRKEDRLYQDLLRQRSEKSYESL